MKKDCLKRWNAGLSLAGVLVLTVLFVLCYGKGTGHTLYGWAAAVICTVLFMLVGLQFVPVWTKEWFEKAPGQSLKQTKEPAYMGAKIFLSFLLVEGMVLLAVFLLRSFWGQADSFFSDLSFWTCLDSRHYLDIARDGYLSVGDRSRVVQLVFLPGYPLLIGLLDNILGSTLAAGLVISHLSFAGAGWVIYRLLRLDYPHQTAVRALKYLVLLPGMFFFAAPMSESLFLLLCASCLYCARTGHWFLGCALGGYAAFTRSPGLSLLVVLLLEAGSFWLKEKDIRAFLRRCAAMLLVPAGFCAYCFINWRVSGNPFQFMVYQREHWHQQMGMFFNTAAYQLENAVHSGPKSPELWGLWLPNLIALFGGLLLMVFAVKKMRPSYSAWFMAYYAAAMGATWLLSAPRYLIGFLPMSLAAALAADTKNKDTVLTVLCLVLSPMYLCVFVLRWNVW